MDNFVERNSIMTKAKTSQKITIKNILKDNDNWERFKTEYLPFKMPSNIIDDVIVL